MTQFAVELSSYVPSNRDEIVMQLRRAEKTREEAEAWAIENKQPPFVAQPDPDRFDPMGVAEWTLAMALAWIIWRTPEAVRKHWDTYLFECKEWRGIEAVYPDGRREVGWDARKCQPVSLHDVVRECAKLDPDDTKLKAVASIKSLWVDATGIPHFVAGVNGIPFIRSDIARPEPRRLVIPRLEWIDLSPYDFHVGLADSIATATDDEARYDEVRVWSADVLRIWQGEEKVSEVQSRNPSGFNRNAIASSEVRKLPPLQKRILETAHELWPDGIWPVRIGDRDEAICKEFKRRRETQPAPKSIGRAFKADKIGQS